MKGRFIDFDSLSRELDSPCVRVGGNNGWNEKSVNRRVAKILREWTGTFYFAQILTRQDMRQGLRGEYWRFLRDHSGKHPTDTTMRQWARRIAREYDFHGSNPKKAGEKREPLREIPRKRIGDEDKFDRMAARRMGSLPYGVKKGAERSDDEEAAISRAALGDGTFYDPEEAAERSNLRDKVAPNTERRIIRALIREIRRPDYDPSKPLILGDGFKRVSRADRANGDGHWSP